MEGLSTDTQVFVCTLFRDRAEERLEGAILARTAGHLSDTRFCRFESLETLAEIDP